MVRDACESKRFSVGTMVRAGDFLLRKGRTEAATVAARYGTKHCDGLLPALVLGIRCAFAVDDMDWALMCAEEAVANANTPWPFYKLLAAVKTSQLRTDASTIYALEKLIAQFPAEERWAKALGDVYLRAGNPKRALAILSELVDRGPDRAALRTMLVTAEAARQSGDVAKAAEILEALHARYPANGIVLNNLVHALALDPKTLPRARKLLPRLLEIAGDSYAVLDTAAVVARNSGDAEQAASYLQRAAMLVEKVDPRWLRVNPKAVDIDVYLGDYDYSMDKGTDASEMSVRRKLRSELFPVAKALHRKASGK